MPRILITSGPTRQHLDPVRYLTNGSSGRTGCALARAVLKAGYDVTIVSGPVEIAYPEEANVVSVVSTEEMLAACQTVFPQCDGLIAVAAPCDYRPLQVHAHKIAKTGQPLMLELVETPDIVATLAARRTSQWIVAFALETKDRRMRAMQKIERKSCDLIVVNGPAAMNSRQTEVEIINRQGEVLAALAGDKDDVAAGIFRVIQERLMQRP